MDNLVNILYIVAFSLFIYGLMGLTGPKTAVRGNWIAAAGMGIAVIATLIAVRDTGNWILIIAGLVVGVVLGVPPAKFTKMTEMPQLVAAFNGVGGGTVALIAWAEFLDTTGFSNFKHGEEPTVHIVIGSLFAAIIGSISFWGSLIAFGKLQEILPGRPIGLGKLQQPLNLLLLVGSIAAAVYIGVQAADGGASQLWMIAVLVLAGILGLMVVLPIGGADMPVVISLLNALTGLSAAAAGLALNNTAMIVAGMIVGASGTILTNLMAKAMNRSIPAIVAGGFGGGGGAAGRGGGGGGQPGQGPPAPPPPRPKCQPQHGLGGDPQELGHHLLP
uniref:NAD(P)(+) transhydrogenase (Re/Si-specific) subunit beta n=1 Tax=Nocardia cyriacigeorgica TaxID=135487 RepID=UPI002458A259